MSRGPKASIIELTEACEEVLAQIIRTQTNPQNLVRRAKIVIKAASGKSNQQIADELEINRETVRVWRGRWFAASTDLVPHEEEKEKEFLARVSHVLCDDPRPGTPATFTPEQIVKVIAVACELPSESERPISHWTPRELALEVTKREIVDQISTRTVARFLDEADLKPHQSRYWLNAKIENSDQFDEEVKTICDLYEKAPELAKEGVIIASTDEKTGIDRKSVV